MNKVSVSAPAKLNLRLKVCGRRADGYHLLEMWNVATDLADTVEIERSSPGIRFQQHGGPPVEVERNLAYRAAQSFFEKTGISPDIEINLHKKIPAGAGMGGGSSDAAATLLALKDLYGINDPIDFSAVALSLGADVPYFLNPVPALVMGVGEQIQPVDLSALSGVACVIVAPPVHLNTKKMFSKLTVPARESQPVPLLPPLEYGELLDGLENDFQAVARDCSPEVDVVFKSLEENPDIFCCLTGSGAALYVLPKDPAQQLVELCSEVTSLVSKTAARAVPVHLQVHRTALSGG